MLQRVAQFKLLGSSNSVRRKVPQNTSTRRSFATAHREKIVFGIDYGSYLAKVAVFDRTKARPTVLLNQEDGNVPYWHTAVAVDPITSKLVSGKRAKEIARERPDHAVTKVKKLLGTRPGHEEYEEWIVENGPGAMFVEPREEWGQEEKDMAWDLAKANKVVVALSSDSSRTYSATQLASTTFASMRKVMQEYQATHGGDARSLPEAYLVVPADFDEVQRATIVLAARRAGIQVLKLIEEPIAALYGVRRLENFGWYSITDFGDTLKSYVIRVFDGEPDLYEASYVEMPQVLSHAERAFYKHLAKKVSPLVQLTRRWEPELVKLFDASRDFLIDEPEYLVPEDSILKSSIPYISREARALSSFYAMRLDDIESKLLASISKVAPASAITHNILIGGNSLAYPDISNIVERSFGKRLSDTVSDPATSLAVGAAIKAAEDNGFASTILRGRDYSAWGYPTLSSSYVDTLHHHLHLSKHHVPLASTLNFSTLATYSKIEPLLPAFHEEQLRPENVNKPYPALSYAVLRDPFSGEVEHWARLSIRTPRPPPTPVTTEELNTPKMEPLNKIFVLQDPLPDWLGRELLLTGEPTLDQIQPDLSLLFVMNVTASPLYDTSRNVEILPPAPKSDIPETYSGYRPATGFEELLRSNPDKPQWGKEAFEIIRGGYNTPQVIQASQENVRNILESIQAQKDSHSGFYRHQNRVHDIIQTIITSMRPNDYHAVASTGGMAPKPLYQKSPSNGLPTMGSATCLSGFELKKASDQAKVLDALVGADATGRASSKYLDAISLAHDMFSRHIEEVHDRVEELVKDEIKEMEEAIDQLYGPEEEPLDLPLVIQTDKPEEIPTLWEGDPEDPARWNYPGITPALLRDWYLLYKEMKYLATPEGMAEAAAAEAAATPEERTTDEDGFLLKDAKKFFAEKAQQYAMSREPEEGDMDVDTFSKIKFMQEILGRMEARKSLKSYYGHQYRAVIITDSAPDANQLKEIEAALQRASRDGVSFTFLSIDGSPFDGPFMQMVSRVKGAKTMRLFKEYLWSTEFLDKYGEGKTGWHEAFNEQELRNLSVKVDFPGYTIDKVYGGWMTPEEKARLEMQRTTSTIRFKMGSIEPSYDIIPGPTPMESEGTAMLVKLKPKEGANDAKRASDPDWLYDPQSKSDSTSVVLGSRIKPSAHTPVTLDISWNDRIGTKLNATHILRLTDFNTPVGYSDEPGITKLVRNAKFVELMRKVLHAPFQDKLASFDSDTPSFEIDTDKSGIQFIGQKQENELIRIYDESKRTVIRLANERLLDPDNEGPIPKQYHDTIRVAAHLMNLSAIRHSADSNTIFNPREDLINRLFDSYMTASKISPISMFAKWRTMTQTYIEALEIVKLENPSFQPTLQSKSLTLASFKGDTSPLPVPQKVYTPKFHGMTFDEQERHPELDRRNAHINANRMNSIEFFDRTLQTPVQPALLWATNYALHALESGSMSALDPVWSFIEPIDEDNDIPLGFPHARSAVKSIVGDANWPEWEKAFDQQDRMKEFLKKHPTFEFKRLDLTKENTSLLLSTIHDEKLFLDVLNMVISQVERKDDLREKNAILGPQHVPLSTMREYFMKNVAPLSSPEEVAKVKKIFKRLQKRHAKSEAEAKQDTDLYDTWIELLKKERAHPSTTAQRLLTLLDKVQKEDLEQATKNHAIEEIETIEQRIIDSDSVLLKHLLENRGILDQISTSTSTASDGSQVSMSDADIIVELEKHLPPGFLDRELAQVKRVTFPDRGLHPSQLDEARRIGSRDAAYEEEVDDASELNAGYSHESESKESLLQKSLYERLMPRTISRFESVSEHLGSTMPLEVELGNIPVDWNDRLERLKRKARAVVRSRILREDEEKTRVRNRLRDKWTQQAQNHVDQKLWLLHVDKLSEELSLQMSELPYTNPEELQRRLDKLRLDVGADMYSLLVFSEYRKIANASLNAWHHGHTDGTWSLLPGMPQTSRKLLDLLEKHNMMSQQNLLKWRDPLHYWYGDDQPANDFDSVTIHIEGPQPSFEKAFKRTIWMQQQIQSQGESTTSEIHITPEEGGLTVSTGDIHDSSAASQFESETTTESSNLEFDQSSADPSSTEVHEGANSQPETGPNSEASGEAATSSSELEGSNPVENSLNEEATEEAPKVVYQRWAKMTKDPHTRQDFKSDFDWHIYKTQTAVEPMITDPELLAQKRAEVSFDMLDFLNEDGTIDWNHVRTRRMQYPVTPEIPQATFEFNTTYDDRDNTGREVSPTDLNEKELTKDEIEATNNIDVDTNEGLYQAHETTRGMRLQIAKARRSIELEKKWAKRYEPYKIPELAINPIYNPFRDGFDRRKEELAMKEVYEAMAELETELIRDTYARDYQLNLELYEEKKADWMRYHLHMPGASQKNKIEQWVLEDQIRREDAYSAPMLEQPTRRRRNNWSNPYNWEIWMGKDRLAFETGSTSRVDWVYLRAFGFHIPVGWTDFAIKPMDISFPSIGKLFGEGPSPLTLVEMGKPSLFTTKRHPSPGKPWEDPLIQREDDAMVQLKRFPADRYKQAVRKAYEKYFGLVYSENKSRSRQLANLDYLDLNERLTQIGSMDRLVAPAEPKMVTVELKTPEERSAEAARLVRLGLKSLSDSASSSSVTPSSPSVHGSSTSQTPQKPQTLADFNSPIPGYMQHEAPKTLREKWEWAKQFALDESLRDHAIRHEKESFESWKVRQKDGLKRHKTLDGEPLPIEPIVKYPTYAPLSERAGLWSLPGVDVAGVEKEISRQASERRAKARAVLKKELQQAYRDLTADAKHISEYELELSTGYESMMRRRIARLTVPSFPDGWEDYLHPITSIGEEFYSDILEPIDLDLVAQVEKESIDHPASDPTFWNSTDTKSVRQRKLLNERLVSMTSEQLAKWETFMDEVHQRKWKLHEQVIKRMTEINKKRMKQHVRSVYGPIVAEDLEQTNFWHPEEIFEHPLPKGLASLDERVANPNKNYERPNIDRRHLIELISPSYPTSYERLQDFVAESLKAERRAAGLPEEEEEFEEDGGHGHH